MYRICLLSISLGSLVACHFDPSVPATDGVDADIEPADAAMAMDAMLARDASSQCVDECINGGAQYCDPEGIAVDCPLGCSDTGGAHCTQLVPSNGANMAHLMGVSAGLSIAVGQIGFIDSDTGEIFVDSVQVRPPTVGGVDAGIGFFIIDSNRSVLAVDFLTVGNTGTLQPFGTRALVILSRGDVDISGLIDISGGCANGNPECAGVGGGQGATAAQTARGCGAGGNGNGVVGFADETGGGGGGLGQAGASAGDGGGGVAEPGGQGGVLGLCPGPSLTPLHGGSGGGEGGLSGVNGGDGGGGGGGLQLTSLTRLACSGNGEIYAGGAGGGAASDVFGDGGGGGGSGGALLLEAPSIDADGCTLTANGGGGGGGSETGATAGAKGTRDTTQAAGGMPAGNGTAGGLGGSLEGSPRQSDPGVDGTGGGGGGAGIIRLNAPAANLSLSGATISPAHTRGDPTLQ